MQNVEILIKAMLRVDPDKRINIDQVCLMRKINKPIKKLLNEDTYKKLFEGDKPIDVFTQFSSEISKS
jgi:hypothetical protein